MNNRILFLLVLSLILLITVYEMVFNGDGFSRLAATFTVILLVISFYSLFIGGIRLSLMIIIVLALMLYFNCKDHRKILLKIGEPMQEYIMTFYKKHQRYPSHAESIFLMEKAGCNNIRQTKHFENKNKKGEIYEQWSSYYCDYGFIRFYYSISVGDLSVSHDRSTFEVYPFQFDFSRENTRCSASFDENGLRVSGCFQGLCGLKNLSH